MIMASIEAWKWYPGEGQPDQHAAPARVPLSRRIWEHRLAALRRALI